jgi:hypothetical protein
VGRTQRVDVPRIVAFATGQRACAPNALPVRR